jgi:hypothetical protein
MNYTLGHATMQKLADALPRMRSHHNQVRAPFGRYRQDPFLDFLHETSEIVSRGAEKNSDKGHTIIRADG